MSRGSAAAEGQLDVPCPVCGATVVRRHLRVPGLARCRCGLVRSSVAHADFDYGEGYFSTDDPSCGHRNFASETAERYDDARFGLELDWLGAPPSNGRLLDFGSATGGYVLRAAERGWDALGMEPSAAAREIAHARGATSVADVSEARASGPYDVITMHHVLEHLADPVGELRTVAQLLNPRSGRLLIEVPNWSSTERVAAGRTWIDLRPEQHRWQFVPRTLRAVVEASSLTVDDEFTMGEPVPSLGSIALSLGIPRQWFPARQSDSDAAGGGHDSRVGGSRGVVGVAAHAIDSVLGVAKLGKRLIIVARRPSVAPSAT